MTWKVMDVQDHRVRFVLSASLREKPLSALCAEFAGCPTSRLVQPHDMLSKLSRDILYTFAPALGGRGVCWDGLESDGRSGLAGAFGLVASLREKPLHALGAEFGRVAHISKENRSGCPTSRL
jgi:hypothetical protein